MPRPAGSQLASLRRLICVFIALALVAASGCSTIGITASESEELPSEAEAADRYASLETVNATVTTVQTRNNETTVTVTQKRERVGSFAYFERVLSVNRSAGARQPLVSEGGFVVANGSELVFYDPASDELQRVSFQTENSSTEARYPALVSAAKNNRPVSQPTPTPGISPLPAVPPEEESNQNDSAAYRDGNVTVVYNGTETVAGQETYRLELAPASQNMSLQSQTLWLDTDYLFPVKRHTAFVATGDSYEYTTTYRNVTFNPTFEPGTFQLEPDEVPDSAQQIQFNSYESRAMLATAVSLPVPDPAVPAGFGFAGATHRSVGPEVATLRYEATDGGARYRVAVFNETQNVTTGTLVQVGEYEARQSRTNGTVSIAWTANRTTYYVSGSPVDEIDNSTLRRVARSVTETT